MRLRTPLGTLVVEARFLRRPPKVWGCVSCPGLRRLPATGGCPRCGGGLYRGTLLAKKRRGAS